MIEPPASSVQDYQATLTLPDGVEIVDEAENAAALKAAQRMGLGVTVMQGLWHAATETARDPVKTNYEGAMAALQESWGDKTEARLTEANQYINEAAKHWPGLKPWLRQSGLGNDPNFIRKVADLARQRNR